MSFSYLYPSYGSQVSVLDSPLRGQVSLNPPGVTRWPSTECHKLSPDGSNRTVAFQPELNLPKSTITDRGPAPTAGNTHSINVCGAIPGPQTWGLPSYDPSLSYGVQVGYGDPHWPTWTGEYGFPYTWNSDHRPKLTEYLIPVAPRQGTKALPLVEDNYEVQRPLESCVGGMTFPEVPPSAVDDLADHDTTSPRRLDEASSTIPLCLDPFGEEDNHVPCRRRVDSLTWGTSSRSFLSDQIPTPYNSPLRAEHCSRSEQAKASGFTGMEVAVLKINDLEERFAKYSLTHEQETCCSKPFLEEHIRERSCDISMPWLASFEDMMEVDVPLEGNALGLIV